VPFNRLPETIAAFLNAGATPGELAAALIVFANPPTPVAAGDVNGDGLPDLAVSLADLTSSWSLAPGELLVFTCQSGAYQLAFTLASPNHVGAPAIQSVEDLNGDGKAEIVIGMQTLGTYNSFTDVQVLAWTGNSFQNRLIGTTDDIPYPHVQVNPVTEGGLAEIVIQGGLIDAVGAGPQRVETRTWALDPASGNWTVASDTLAPSNYRIHVLQDADADLRKGDVTQALAAYNRVLKDKPPLQDYLDPTTEKLNLGAYAAYKIVVVHLAKGEKDAAQEMLDQLARTYIAGTPQHAFVELAQAYQDALANGGDAAKACTAVTEYSQAHTAQVLDPLGPQSFGYANRTYTPQDMCP
jgi:hypothetical protein